MTREQVDALVGAPVIHCAIASCENCPHLLEAGAFGSKTKLWVSFEADKVVSVYAKSGLFLDADGVYVLDDSMKWEGADFAAAFPACRAD